jgi:hypothetical protein
LKTVPKFSDNGFYNNNNNNNNNNKANLIKRKYMKQETAAQNIKNQHKSNTENKTTEELRRTPMHTQFY